MAKKILLCVAAKFELPPSFPYDVLEVGVGLLPAFSRFSQIARQKKSDLVILLGTAGILNFPSIDLTFPMPAILCHKFTLPPYAFEERPSLVPEVYFTGGIEPLDQMCSSNYLVYSPFGITVKENVFQLKEDIIYLENLEALALAAISYENKIPFYALLSVTNPVGEKARELWKKNYQKAGYFILEKLSEILAQF